MTRGESRVSIKEGCGPTVVEADSYVRFKRQMMYSYSGAYFKYRLGLYNSV